MKKSSVLYIFISLLALISLCFRGYSQILVTPAEYLFSVNFKDSSALPLFPKVYMNPVSNMDCQHPTERKPRNTWMGRKIHNEHFLLVDSSTYTLIIDPAVHFSIGKQTGYAPTLSENTRGIRISGDLHKKLFFSSELYETQRVFPSYLEAFADSFEVAPGLMRAKEFKEYGRDYATVYGTLVWMPVSSFQLWFARDKLHFGHGHRSMLLSENAPASTFVRTSINRKKWSYHFILASLQNVSLQNIIDVPQSSMGGYQNKYANFSIISFNPIEQLEISLFESMIWAPHNQTYNSLQWKHFNPVPFSRTAYYGMDNKNNTMAGLQLSMKLPYNLLIYGQYAIDETGNLDKAAMQAGLGFEKKSGCRFIKTNIEYNSAGAYTFTHTDPLQSYSHYHHSLAHPLGANFREILLKTSVTDQRWAAYAMFSFVQGGVDTEFETTGQSIYADPAFANWNGGLFPALTTTNASMMFADVRAHYFINKTSNLNVFINGVYRKTINTPNPLQSIEFHAGISTSLRTYCQHQTWF